MNPQQTIRLAVIDSDSGFVTVLSKRAETAGWQLRVLTSAIPPEELVAMKLNALLLDPSVLGDEGWAYLERVCAMLPDLGVVVCTGRSTVAQRVRGLRLGVDDWITKPCHPEEAMARVEAVSRRRRRGHPDSEAGPVFAGELEIRPDQFQAFVSGAKYLHHVHLATKKSRIAPGQEPHSFIEGMKGLKQIGYQDFCSLECTPLGDKMVEIPKAVKFLRRQWAEAT